ncbi:MAG: hypothetical protein DRH08_14145 [Deltaproteobacteria bacterium]|nr:MAG: hypothetical protein DRH08_14145 [Deltaproteobacteria bacterium]
MLDKAGVTTIHEGAQPVAEEDTILLFRSDFLFDQRIIGNMIGDAGIILEANTPQGPRPVAAHVSGALSDDIEHILCSDDSVDYPVGLRRESAETLVPVYQKKLLKIDPPYILPISEDKRRSLEKRLFAGSYKGVTDLVTKWLWPVPARWATGFCARNGIVPNHVTSLSLV